MRTYTLDRWNWSERAKKWVYVSLNGSGRRRYHYQVKPPEEFVQITIQMARVNEKLLHCEDPVEAELLFRKLQSLGNRLQAMGKGNS